MLEQLDGLVRRRRALHAHVLEWDYALLYALERQILPDLRFGLATHRRLHFRLDAEHPLGASHHQKLVMIHGVSLLLSGNRIHLLASGAVLTRLDRVQLAVMDRAAAAARWRLLFDTEVVREDRVAWLAARRTVLRVGESELELLEADGVGPVAQHCSRVRSAVFAAGFAVEDLAAAAAALEGRGVHHVAEGGQLHLTGEWLGVPALRVVLSRDEPRAPAGLLARLYEVTHLVRGHARAAERLARVFDLDPAGFVPIRSPEFGYEGLLAMLRPDRLDRVETVTPLDRTKPMGRFFARQGPCLYMFYAEARDAAAARARVLEHAADAYAGPREGREPDNFWVHPRALAGALLGVSRESFGWTWSGHPERVVPAR